MRPSTTLVWPTTANTFSPTGEILNGHPKVEAEQVYLVEPPDGPSGLLKPSEFRKRAGR